MDIVADVVVRAITREPRRCEVCHTHIKMIDGQRTCICQMAPRNTTIKVDKIACIVDLAGAYSTRTIVYVRFPEPAHADMRPDTRQLQQLAEETGMAQAPTEYSSSLGETDSIPEYNVIEEKADNESMDDKILSEILVLPGPARCHQPANGPQTRAHRLI